MRCRIDFTYALAIELDDPGFHHSVLADFTGGKGVRLAFDPIAGPGVETLAQGIAPSGYLVVHGALDPRTTPLPNAQSFPAPNTSTYTLFEITPDPERLRRAVAFINAGLASAWQERWGTRPCGHVRAPRRIDGMAPRTVLAVLFDGLQSLGVTMRYGALEGIPSGW
ncbi:hypothetical protein [Streptomyces sp. Ag82_G6-1]|uniref:hypothetical protein n=1 Tax=Streptomyces sp. Ag82_G6-1 TaxID=1938853 RepID=UPI00269BB100